MNDTIQSNQSYQKFKEILTARHIIKLSPPFVDKQSWSPKPDDC